MSKEPSVNNVNLIIDALVALATIAVAVIAIWGEKIRSWLAPARIEIKPHTFTGDPTILSVPGVVIPGGGTRAMYYHLKVVNIRPWLTVQNCRVLLKGISRRGPDGRFHPVRMAVPLQFVWAPSDSTPQQTTITKEHVLDFGRIVEGEPKFTPLLYSYTNNFQGCVEKGAAVRYSIEVDASNFVSPEPYVVEVAWDGHWEFEVEKMAQHLRITEINEAEKT